MSCFVKFLLWAVLPSNIIPSLRKVTTPGGYLTFERFCAGLKIAILRHSAQRHRQANTDSSEGSMVRIHVFFFVTQGLWVKKVLVLGKSCYVQICSSEIMYLIVIYLKFGLCGFLHLHYIFLKPLDEPISKNAPPSSLCENLPNNLLLHVYLCLHLYLGL